MEELTEHQTGNKRLCQQTLRFNTTIAKHYTVSLWQETGPCSHALPHLIVQIHEVPLEVMEENVVLASAAKRRGNKTQQESETRKGPLSRSVSLALSLSLSHSNTQVWHVQCAQIWMNRKGRTKSRWRNQDAGVLYKGTVSWLGNERLEPHDDRLLQPCADTMKENKTKTISWGWNNTSMTSLQLDESIWILNLHQVGRQSLQGDKTGYESRCLRAEHPPPQAWSTHIRNSQICTPTS